MYRNSVWVRGPHAASGSREPHIRCAATAAKQKLKAAGRHPAVPPTSSSVAPSPARAQPRRQLQLSRPAAGGGRGHREAAISTKFKLVLQFKVVGVYF
eukprot:SAG31_NODE_231_length_19768_cov_9.498170_6_plen_98_part_00